MSRSAAPRIILIHAYRHSLPPIERAFRKLWPEAEVLSLVDEALYADIDPDGVAEPTIPERIRTLFSHALVSGAEAIVFTGSTFGPIVEEARRGMPVPVLKSDESMAMEAVDRGGRALLVCTAQRALPVIARTIMDQAEASGADIDLATLVVEGAKHAIDIGDAELHNRLIAQAILDAGDSDSILLGQLSMSDVPALLPAEIARKVLSNAEATVRRLRLLLS
jgi:hypothetical protein